MEADVVRVESEEPPGDEDVGAAGTHRHDTAVEALHHARRRDRRLARWVVTAVGRVGHQGGAGGQYQRADRRGSAAGTRDCHEVLLDFRWSCGAVCGWCGAGGTGGVDPDGGRRGAGWGGRWRGGSRNTLRASYRVPGTRRACGLAFPCSRGRALPAAGCPGNVTGGPTGSPGGEVAAGGRRSAAVRAVRWAGVADGGPRMSGGRHLRPPHHGRFPVADRLHVYGYIRMGARCRRCRQGSGRRHPGVAASFPLGGWRGFSLRSALWARR